MSRVRYGVQIEFDVDDVFSGGPSKADIRRYLREAVEGWRGQFLGDKQEHFASLGSVGIKYLHEASTGAPRALSASTKSYLTGPCPLHCPPGICDKDGDCVLLDKMTSRRKARR